MKSALRSARYERMKRAFWTLHEKPGKRCAAEGREQHRSKDCTDKHAFFLLCPFPHGDAMPACQKTIGKPVGGEAISFALENEIFRAAIVPHPPCTPPDTIGYSKGLRLFAFFEFFRQSFMAMPSAAMDLHSPRLHAEPFSDRFQKCGEFDCAPVRKNRDAASAVQRNFSRHCLCSASASLWYSR